MKYWNEAFYTSVFLINKLPTKVLNNKSPHEMIYSVRPKYGFLKAYGCLCFPCLRDYNNHKLSMRSSPCTFIGYAQNQKGYKCMDKNGKIYVSRHVIFDENKFPYAEKQITKKDGEQSINNNIRFKPFITEPPSIDRNEEQQHTGNLNTQEETMD